MNLDGTKPVQHLDPYLLWGEGDEIIPKKRYTFLLIYLTISS